MSFILLSAFVAAVTVAPAEPGNLLWSDGFTVTEYTRAGQAVQSFPLPPTPGEESRDLVMSGRSTLFVYNGVFNPRLARGDLRDGTWTFNDLAGWSTVYSGSYGGIALVGPYVFASDMTTHGSPEDAATGVVRYDRVTGAFTRPVVERPYVSDVASGPGGTVYSYNGGEVRIYDAESMQQLGEFSFIGQVDHPDPGVIAVDDLGRVYLGDFYGYLHRFSSAGVLEKSTYCESFRVGGCGEARDVEIAEDGLVVVANRDGHILLLDQTLDTGTWFATTTFPDGSYIAAVTLALFKDSFDDTLD